MDNPEKQATLGTQESRQDKHKQNTTQRRKLRDEQRGSYQQRWR